MGHFKLHLPAAGRSPRDVAWLAAASRVLTVLLAAATRAVFQPYDASTELWMADLAAAHSSTGKVLSSPTLLDRVVRFLCVPLLSWDGGHFLPLAMEGYVAELSHVFYPLLPWAVRLTQRVFFSPLVTWGWLGLVESFALAAATLNGVAFVAAAVALFHLSYAVFLRYNGRDCNGAPVSELESGVGKVDSPLLSRRAAQPPLVPAGHAASQTLRRRVRAAAAASDSSQSLQADRNHLIKGRAEKRRLEEEAANRTAATLFASTASTFFVLTPAGVFMSAAYSEALFCALSFGGMLALQKAVSGPARATTPPPSQQPSSSSSWPHRLMSSVLPRTAVAPRLAWYGLGATLLAIAAAARSNGVLLGIYLLEPLLHALAYAARRQRAWGHAAATAGAFLFAACALLLPTAIVTYAALSLYCGSEVLAGLPSWLSAATSSFASAWGGQVGGGESGVVIPPPLALQPRPYCPSQHPPSSLFSSLLSAVLPPSLHALAAPPPVYAWLQTHYWGVRLGGYWKAAHLPHWLVAAPILWGIASRLRCSAFMPSLPPRSWCPKVQLVLLPFIIHCGALAVVAFAYAHVQVILRLTAACPALYWAAASAWMRASAAQGWPAKVAGGGLLLSRSWLPARRVALVAAPIAYSVIGTMLFACFYPWT